MFACNFYDHMYFCCCCYCPPHKFKFASLLSIFHICCRSVIPIVVQLSPRYRKLKDHIFPVSLQLQVHLFLKPGLHFSCFLCCCIWLFHFMFHFFSNQYDFFSYVHVSSISWLNFMFNFLFFHQIFISFPFIFSVLTMLLKLPWLTIFNHLNLCFNF